MNPKTYPKLKARWWQEIKSLEQEYKRNSKIIKDIMIEQSGISFKIQETLNRIEKETAKYNNHEQNRMD